MGRHNIVKRLLNIGLVLVVSITAALGPATTSMADQTSDKIAEMQQQEAETQETISNLEKETKATKDAINNLQNQKAESENNINNLQNKAGELQNEINGYSNQLDVLSEEINEAEEALAQVSAEIVQLNYELNAAREEEATQYALLKKQIQSTYESGGTDGMLMKLLSCGTIADFLTQTEYVSAIVSYDQRKIQEYQELEASIEAKKALVEEKQAELDAYQATLDEKHGELADLTDSVKGQLSNTNGAISSEKGKIDNFNAQLTELDNKMKSLESQTAAAQAKLAQQIAERLALVHEDTSGSYAASDTELVWLAATIQAEAGGESYTGKLGVGSVIMNRVKSSNFPNNVIGVITQNMQFASYRSGKVELIIANGPNSTCIQAAQEVLNGARIGDYLFFMTKYYADYYGIMDYVMIGNHAFFYRWVTKPKEEPHVEETTSVEDTSSDDTSDDDTVEYTDDDDDDDDEDEDDDEDDDD